MATPTFRGISDVNFGIPTVVSFAYLEQIDQDNDPEYQASVKDQTGITIGIAYGPTMMKANFQGWLRGNTPVAVGTVFAYNGFNYIVEKVTLAVRNADYTRSTFSATFYPGIPNP